MGKFNALFAAGKAGLSSLADAAVEVVVKVKAAHDAQIAADEVAAKQAAAEKAAKEYAEAKAKVAAYEAEQRAKAAAEKAARIAALEAQIAGWNESIVRMSNEWQRASDYDNLIHDKMNEVRARGEKVSDSLFQRYIRACDDRSAIYEARESARKRVKMLEEELAALKNS